MMAAKESRSGGINKEEIDDITTCCICTEVYTDPKALPCIHTFCMKCIQETGLKTSKGPGDEMPCPVCRGLFKIPPEGFSGLPKNFFIERLIQMSKVSATELCSLCLEESEGQTGAETPIADTYCVDCKCKLCEECCSEHKRFKATKNHKLMPLTEYKSSQNVMTNLVPIVCEVHEQKVLDVYCTDCKTVLCAICFIEEHKTHEGSHVSKCVDGFRKQIESNAETMNSCIAKAQMKKEEIMKVKEEMHQMVENLESDVEKRKEEIKKVADKHASNLRQGICSEWESRLKEIQMATGDTDAYISNLENYNSNCQRILDKGSANDICSALSGLSVRALELQHACQPVIERDIPNFRYSFSHSELEEFLNEDGGNLVGEFEEEGNLKSKKRSKRVLLAELSNEIDLLRKQIEKERTEKQSLQSTIEQQRINADREAQNLREELIKREANYNNHVEKLKQELDELQLSRGRLKQELAAEKTTNNSLQVNNDKFAKELELCKATLKTAETNTEKPMKKLGDSDLVTVPRNTVAVAGQTAYFNCSTTDENPRIHWNYYDDYVYAGGIFLRRYNRFRIEIDKFNRSCNLVIPNVTRKDAGRYLCLDNEGLGGAEKRSAELVVLEANPLCSSDMTAGEIVGPNNCNIDPEEVRLSCNVTYKGGILPILKWTRLGDSSPISTGRTVCSNSTDTLHCEMTIRADHLRLDGSSYICHPEQTTNINCKLTSDVVDRIYLLNDFRVTERSINDELRCKANSSQRCHYRWVLNAFDGSSAVLLNQSTVTANLSGIYRCESQCTIRGKQCYVSVMLVYVPRSSHITILTIVLVILAALLAVCVVGRLICYKPIRWRKPKEKLTGKRATIESDAKPDEVLDKHLSKADDDYELMPNDDYEKIGDLRAENDPLNTESSGIQCPPKETGYSGLRPPYQRESTACSTINQQDKPVQSKVEPGPTYYLTLQDSPQESELDKVTPADTGSPYLALVKEDARTAENRSSNYFAHRNSW